MLLKRIVHEIRFLGRDKTTAIIESPYFVKGNEEATAENVKYAELCMEDSLNRGEAPFLSHLLYTRKLDDNKPEQRKLGIEAGLRLGKLLYKTVVYTDRGISPGMIQGILSAEAAGRPVEYRTLYGNK